VHLIVTKLMLCCCVGFLYARAVHTDKQCTTVYQTTKLIIKLTDIIKNSQLDAIIIIIIIFLHELGRLTCSGIDALPSFPGASTVSSSSRFVVEGVFRESGVVHSFKVVDQVLFVFESHVLYSRDL